MAGLVDLVTSSTPCQPFSKAGRRLGKEDPRNYFPDTLRVVREVGPRYVLLENVRGLADGDNPYSAEVIGGLSEAGYDSIWGLHSASEVGALHLRERWFCLAYTHTDSERSVHPEAGLHPAEEPYEPLGDAGAVGEQVPNSRWLSIGSGPWGVESGLDRVVDGVADRVERITALGNAIVPAVVARFLT
jgi:DNA (cytosine-5)-methyltransferase 1